MKASLTLEAIGDNTITMLRLWSRVADAAMSGGGEKVFGKIPPACWVAEVRGPDSQYKWQRRFLRGKKDYTRANSVGSRGVYVCYILESGLVYEVKERVSWGRSRRYFCRVSEGGEVIEIPEDEVTQWLPH